MTNRPARCFQRRMGTRALRVPGRKKRRSGSQRTLESYGMRKSSGKRRSHEPGCLRAHSTGVSGREPSAITIGARMSCLSSFYRFLMRMGIVRSNPCDMLERPKTQTAPPRGLTPEQVRTVLAAMPDTLKSRRDRAIILTLLLTGRRRSEVLNLKAGVVRRRDTRIEGNSRLHSRRSMRRAPFCRSEGP